MKTTRLIEAMSWKALREKYFIGTININGKTEKLNQLSEAIEAGELDVLVQECADALHGGDTYSVYAAWSRNLSSIQTTMKKRAYIENVEAERARYAILREFVTRKMEELKGSSRSGNSKAYWLWTLEEIEAIPMEDLRTIQSVYDNMASKKSKDPDAVAQHEDFYVRLEAVSLKLTAAKKLAKKVRLGVSESLLAKLNKGGTAVLSKAEAQQLIDLIGSIDKI